jgi:hypothetical protein
VKLLLIIIYFNLYLLNICYAGPGTTSAQFLKLGIGGRASGMGYANAAVVNDVTALYWNPAGLNNIQTQEISFMQCLWFEDINYQFVGYARPTDKGTFAGSLNFLSMAPINKYDNTGTALGQSYAPADMALTFGYARLIKTLPVGLNIKYVSSKIDVENATAIAIDLGTQYTTMQDKLTLAFVIQNMGTSVKYLNESMSLPFNIKLGTGYKLDLFGKPGLVALDINMPNDNDININLGTELLFTLVNGTTLNRGSGSGQETPGLTG